MALHAGAWITFFFGEIEESTTYCTRLLEHTKDSPCAYYTGTALFLIGYHTALGGDTSKGRTLIEEGFSHLSSEGGMLFHTVYAMILGRVHIIDKNFAEGLACIEKGIHIANEHKEFCYMSELLRIRGSLYRLVNDEEKAETDCISAMHVAAHLKSIPAELDACIALAEVLTATEREDEAEYILGMMLAKIPKQSNLYASIGIARIRHTKGIEQRKHTLEQ